MCPRPVMYMGTLSVLFHGDPVPHWMVSRQISFLSVHLYLPQCVSVSLFFWVGFEG